MEWIPLTLVNQILRWFRKDKCSMKGCNEPRKKGDFFPSAFCYGHWYVNIVQPTFSQGSKDET